MGEKPNIFCGKCQLKLKILEFLKRHKGQALVGELIDFFVGQGYKRGDVKKAIKELRENKVIKKIDPDLLVLSYIPLSWDVEELEKGEKTRNREKKNGKNAEILDSLINCCKENNNSCLIVVHHNADPDAIGSAAALSSFLRRHNISSKIVALDGISSQSKRMIEKFPINVETEKENVDPNNSVVVIIDTASSAQIPNARFLIEDKEKKKIFVLDHHEAGDLKEICFKCLIDSEAKATAVIIKELFDSYNHDLSKEEAVFITLGIIADTGFLRKASNRELLCICQIMGKFSISLQEMFSVLHIEKDYSEKIAILKGLKRMEVWSDGEIIICISEIGSFEASLANAMIKNGADISIAANVKKDCIRISCRCKERISEKVDMLKILKVLEEILKGKSGGHRTAASFNGENPDKWEDAKKVILEEIEKAIGKKLKKV